MEIPECLNCGACCAKEPLWIEVTQADYERLGNPALTVPGDIEPYAMKMKGYEPQCIALIGTVGACVKCNVYERRPEICRKVERGSEICLYMLGWHKVGRGY